MIPEAERNDHINNRARNRNTETITHKIENQQSMSSDLSSHLRNKIEQYNPFNGAIIRL